MIRRLYVDNFRSLVDFTWRPGAETLVLGANGSGKTTALDAIDVIRKWTHGWQTLETLLTFEDLTRWSEDETIRLHLDLEERGTLFTYRADFVYDRRAREVRIAMEILLREDDVVFARTNESVLQPSGEEGALKSFPVPTSQSAVNALASAQRLALPTAFLNALARLILVRPLPPAILSEARRPMERPSPRFENFIAWYWSQSGNGKFAVAAQGLLTGLWEDFDNLRIDRVGRDAAVLSVVFRHAGGSEGELLLDFSELSEGERMLVVLYSLLAYQRAVPATSLIVDEPDNFVALAELQPWLLRLLDERPEGGQIILVSHNAEIIETMGEEKVAYFSRENHTSPSHVTDLAEDDTGLSLSERLARGWIDQSSHPSSSSPISVSGAPFGES